MSLSTAGDLSQQAFNNTSKVVEQLGMAIVSGDYAERTMIPLDPDLEEMFGVSRTVVREAKKTLVGKGLVQSKAKVGTRVRPSSDWNMFDADVLRWHAALRKPGPFLEELFEIRLLLEPAAAALVAARASNADYLRLNSHCEFMATASDSLTYAAANIEFHTSILHMSGNRFLSSLGDMVQAALFSVYRRGIDQSDADLLPSENREVVEDYRAIVEAVRTGDALRAEQLMAKLIQRAQSGIF
ncbi:transcriptional regulator, GntR family [Cohaesibacter sp. ES.047]|uniref:FadR/GntR family transcriptional regulator n=1 Tax=Cohaesibacter sp. ES.047 TaxID=1798205 RepID=UPI000BB8C6EC|nr:FCD domain-containing protein [Cohaesibacter sp. ES.047]SNY89987.1 transcriptional regulator, GntR family [Cohaesibacter sp. ES.047]